MARGSTGSGRPLSSGLAATGFRAHLMRMNPPWRFMLIAPGWVLIVLAPVVGILPGPGGIFLFAGGVALLLRNSRWARRRYAMLVRRWPKLGRACDRVLRRPSVRRRAARATD